jgi:chemotaxis protein MotB
MAENKSGKAIQPIIIIKKIKKAGHGGHHGGAWKIAYADFVTAMMAFFLLMWLLAYADPGTKQGIADYFNRPLKSMLTAGPGAAPTSAPKTPAEKKEQQKKIEAAKLEELKKKLDSITEHNPKLRAFKNQIKIEITTEGLRIQIVDLKNRPMFAVGSAVLEDYTKVILDAMGPKLNDVENPVSIAGHTDALKYAGGDKGYSNWELSSERANAARRELVIGGMDERKVMQVRGLAGSVPLDKDLSSPRNRRISIVVLNAETVARLRQDGTVPPAGTTGLPEDQLTTGAASATNQPLNLGPGAATVPGAVPGPAIDRAPAAGAGEKPAPH